MSPRPARFTQVDLRRAIKTARDLGDDYAVDILPNGTIRISRIRVDHPDKADEEERLVF
jgi:hypothetical protein